MNEQTAAYPVWPRVVAAFVAGMLFSAFCIVQITPREGDTGLTAGPIALGEGYVTDGGGDATAATDDTVVDANGQVVRKSGSAGKAGKAGTAGSTVIRKTGGTGGTGGTAGTAGTAGSAGRTGGSSGSGSAATGGTTGTGTNNTSGSGGGLECAAGRNGGNLGGKVPGVTGTEIKIAATVVKDGPGKSLLESSETGMRAVLNKVNAAGGVCGRRLSLTTVNDGWDAARGLEYIRRFIEEGYFALPVVPSSEGLSEAINSHVISDAGIPVVGTNGLRVDQYGDPWTFPVGAATVSVMRAMAKHALSNPDNKKFGIVWDSKYKFGREGATAFKNYVTSHGGTIAGDMPLDPDLTSYGTQAQQFNSDCGTTNGVPGCDVVVLLLVPDTAGKWKSANPASGGGRGKITYGAQTLFTDDFGRSCAAWCSGMVVWTGYNPSIPPVDSLGGVSTYVNDVKAINPGIDYRNQFLEGAYLGMQVFVEAVKKCSPNLSRTCVKEYLDANPFPTDLASTLTWGPGNHYANKAAQPFSIDATGGSFNGWRQEPGGFVTDPELG